VRFVRPVTLGDTITITTTVKQKFPHNRHVLFDCVCTNQEGLEVVVGTAEISPPREKIRTRRVALPGVTISDKYARLQALVARAKGLPPIDMAVVHPCDEESLKGALMAADAG
jgi:phosphate acetyltransferase